MSLDYSLFDPNQGASSNSYLNQKSTIRENLKKMMEIKRKKKAAAVEKDRQNLVKDLKK